MQKCPITGLSPSWSYKKYKCRCEVCLADRKRGRDKFKEENARRAREWRLANPERSRANARSYQTRNAERLFGARLLRTYGISLEDYKEMLSAQGHKCAICDRADNNDKRPAYKKFHVDHDHATGLVRGLLCSTCNTGIGKFQDNTDLLRKAIDYLTH